MTNLRVILGFRGPRMEKKMYWEPLRAINPHCLITGTSGAGKTQLLKTLSAELARQGTPVVVFDVHGEYKDLVEDLGGRYLDFYSEVRINPLDPSGKIPRAVAFEVREIIANIFKGLGAIQLNLLYELILEAFKEKGFDLDKKPRKNSDPPDFNDLARILEAKRAEKPKDKSLEGLLARLKPLLDFDIFASEHGLSISKFFEPGITVIDLSTLPVSSDELKTAVVVFTSKKLWDHLQLLRPVKAPQLRLALVLDEAHRYVFEYSPINYMLREGRKFGISVLLASQMLSDMPAVATANTSLKIALKLDEPKDIKKVVDVFKEIESQDIPERRFEALACLDGQVERITIIPYHKYRELDLSSTKEVAKSAAMVIDSTAVEGGPTTLEELVEVAVRENNVPLLDALHQWAENPTSATAGYGVEENYQFILKNLRTRYDEKTAEETVETLRTFISRIMEAERDVYKLREEIEKLLSKTEGLELLKRETLRRISKLSPSEKLALYLALESLTESEESRHYYLLAVQEVLEELGLRFDQEELKRIAVWSGAASELLWISARGYSRTVFKLAFMDEIYEELEKSSKVVLLRDEFVEAAREAIEVWHVEALRALLELEKQGYFKTHSPLQLAGPEKYAKVLARHIRRIDKLSAPHTYYIIPKRFKDLITDALKPLKQHVERVEELVGNYIVNYIKTHAPYAERSPGSARSCAGIRVKGPGGEAERFDVCVLCDVEAEMISTGHDAIIVAALAPLDVCTPSDVVGKRMGLIIVKPKVIIGCAGTLGRAAKEFFEGLKEHLEANL